MIERISMDRTGKGFVRLTDESNGIYIGQMNSFG